MKIYTKQEFDAKKIAESSKTIYSSGFENACEYFRQICGEIGELIGDSEFKGGYDDMPIFYAHESYKTDKGVQLAIAWAGVNDLCKYEASKLGIGSPDWWYKCWEETNPEPKSYKVRVTCNEDFYVKMYEPTSQGVSTTDFLVMAAGESFILKEYEDYLYHVTSCGVTIKIMKGSRGFGEMGLFVYVSGHYDLKFKISDDENIFQINKTHIVPGTVSGSITLTPIPVYE